MALPQGAYWHTEGWTGAVLPYSVAASSERPHELLLEYLQKLQVHGKNLVAQSFSSETGI